MNNNNNNNVVDRILVGNFCRSLRNKEEVIRVELEDRVI